MSFLRVVGTTGAMAMALALPACGGEEREATPPALSSARVAMTVEYPGYQPFALITYRDPAGRRCHGLGSVTPQGPRVMGALENSLTEGLTTRGTCLAVGGRDISVQVRKAGRGAPRIVGGIVREGVTRIVVAGQTIRPRRGGEFLFVQPPDAGALGDDIELEYTAGQHRRLPLHLVSS